MAGRAVRVYCAGPLFNAKEQEEMQELATALERAHFDTFLPQRDGLELTKVVEALTEKGMDAQTASDITARAIFALDVYQVVDRCQAIVVNLNGRVPDEGAVSEAAIAWCHGKVVVGYKSDSRSVFLGQDNPLVNGLFDFKPCRTVQEVVRAVAHAFDQASQEERAALRSEQLTQYLTLGMEIWAAASSANRVGRITEILLAQATSIHQRMPACSAGAAVYSTVPNFLPRCASSP